VTDAYLLALAVVHALAALAALYCVDTVVLIGQLP